MTKNQMNAFTEDNIHIQAPTSKVWHVLTDPSLTPQYMFGCEVICDWQIGSPIIWKGIADGVVYVKGELLSFVENQEFSFTIFDPNSSYEDIPTNYLTATYVLTDVGEGTELSVTQGDYTQVADGKKRYEDTVAQGGWSAVLEQIRVLAEK